MVEVFIVLMEHDSTDTNVEVFTDREDAILFARGWAAENGEVKYHHEENVLGWEFYLGVGVDGGRSVRVEKKIVDSEAAAVRHLRAARDAERIAGMTANLEAAGYEVVETEVCSTGTTPSRFEVTLRQPNGSLTFAAATRRKAWENLAVHIPSATEAPK